MDILGRLVEFWPFLAVFIVAALLVYGVQRIFARYPEFSSQHTLLRGLIILALVGVGLVGAIIALPVEDSTRSQLLTLVGIVISAVITLSSTTFVGNAMAGLMVRGMKKFRPGDFIKVGGEFGRVTEQGILSAEIQTEKSELTTISNLLLVTQPVTVIRSSGTIVSARVSLGYDVPRAKVEKALIEAVERTKLKDPFVHVLELGDFSVTYRASGFLEDVKTLISTRSRLRENILDSLSGHGIEIVSPTFMNQRALPPEKVFIPEPVPEKKEEDGEREGAEEKVFKKAERAALLEDLKSRLEQMVEETAALKEERSKTENEDARAKADEKMARNDRYKKFLEEKIEAEKVRLEKEKD
ncbi:MAG: mechanosensitive ion channel domain-containing protein [Candidatus Nitrospinota bacterium M3_3B_026]